MPPTVRITREEIIKTAVGLVREKGEKAINARTLAAALNCSTQPIFFNFNTMEKLQEAVLLAAYDLYMDFLKREAEKGEYSKYKAFGMAYIRFAKEEKELFKLLFMKEKAGKDASLSADFEESVQLIMKATGLTQDKAKLMHLEMWTCVHGIGTMLATSFLSLEWEIISEILTDVYQGICARHLAEVK